MFLVTLGIVLLVLAESLLFAYSMHQATGGRWILPIDDAYIHQQYAVQAARGRPFQYDDQASRSSGATSLLYPFVLAIAWRAGLQGDLLSAFAFALGAACLLGSALVMTRIASQIWSSLGLDRASIRPMWVGLLPALLLTNGALVWGFLSGMEGGLFTLFLLATLDAFLARKPRWTALYAGLLALTRPEGLILVGLLALVAGAGKLWGKHTEARWSWCYLLPLVLGMLQPVLNLALTGSLTANGMRAKSWLYNVPRWPLPILRSVANTALEIWAALLTGLETQDLRGLPGSALRAPSQVMLYMPPLLAAAGIVYLTAKVVRDGRRGRFEWPLLVLLWIVGGLMATALMGTASWHYHRYQLPFFALGLLAGAVAVAVLTCRPGARRHAEHAFFFALAVLLSCSIWSMPGFVWRYREAVRTTLNQQVRLGEWIKANLPPGVVVGVHDAGAIAYFGERPIYDLVGLAAPPVNSSAWRNGSGSVYEQMERSAHPPDYFAIYDDVYALPYFVNTNVFQRELFRAEAENTARVAAASDRQIVFAADWSLRDSGDNPYQSCVLTRVRESQLVDSLDVADLVAERAHGYRWWQTRVKTGFPSDAFQLTYHLPPHSEVMDGGRLITGGEAFELRTVPGQDALLVGRFLGQSPVRLQVKVNGQVLGPWGYGPIPGRWQEQAIEIPAAMITSTKTHVEIDVDTKQPDLEFHRPFYYWCYQGSLAEEAPQIAQPLDAQVGQGIVLLGYSLAETKTQSAYQLDLDLYWQATTSIVGDYKVFVHWSDEKDTILTQRDGRPGHDLRPTWLWRPGETIVDHYTLALPLSAQPPAQTILYVGMYDAQKGDRLPIAGGDAASRLELKRIALPPSDR